MAKYVVAEKLPGPGVQSDDELLDYAPANGSTVYHASCSCMMGQHAMAVVDDQLRVHGVESLRVIDASVMPAQLIDGLPEHQTQSAVARPAALA